MWKVSVAAVAMTVAMAFGAALPAANFEVLAASKRPSAHLPAERPAELPMGEPERIDLAGLSVSLWRPAGAGIPAPLVIFSHGFHGCSTQSSFLMSALADHGYLAIAPEHRDSACGGGRPKGAPERPFRDAAAWTEQTHAHRGAEIQRLIDALAAAPRLSKAIDWSRVALAGHSLGGYSVLGSAGAWPSWKLRDVTLSAVLALAPYCEPILLKGALGEIKAPVMIQAGARDASMTLPVKRAGGAYDKLGGPAVYVELEGAGHFAWTDTVANHQEEIVHYALVFLDAYLKGAPGDAMVKPYGAVSEVRAK